MIEQAIIDFLQGALDVPCSAETPKDPPAKYIVVERTNTTCENGLYGAILAIRSCAPTLYEAAVLSKQVRGAMLLDLLAEPWIAGVELTGDYPFTDTATKQPRYQAVFNVKFYEEEIQNGKV
nr:hypothetical protein [uncultured Dysosmobacter sp.]